MAQWFWIGYMLGRIARGKLEAPEYDVVYENGILYIKAAPATQDGSTLEVK